MNAQELIIRIFVDSYVHGLVKANASAVSAKRGQREVERHTDRSVCRVNIFGISAFWQAHSNITLTEFD